MKKLNFYALAIAGLLFAACTTDRDVAVGDEPQKGSSLSDGYMALNINLPTTPQVRAANDDFDDGTPSEYRVHDCALLLFEGNAGGSAADAKFLNVQEISLPFNKEESATNSPDNITTSYLAVAKVSGHSTEKQLWGLILLNYNNVATFTNGEDEITFTAERPTGSSDENYNKLTTNDSFSKLAGLVTKANLTTDESKKDDVNKNRYFFMTNAVLSTAPGGNVTVPANAPKATNLFQLVSLSGKVYSTPELAIANPAGEILVERAVAKATLSCDKSNANQWKTEDGLSFTITKVEWAIDNTEPSSYIVRNPGSATYIGYCSDYYTSKTPKSYRFVGDAKAGTSMNTILGTGTESEVGEEGYVDYYRTYWCVDPQYAGVDGAKITPTMSHIEEIALIEENTTPLYCYENTFNVKNQNYKNTTRAIIKVTIEAKKGETPVTDLYAINGDGLIYTHESVESRIIDKIVNNRTFKAVVESNLQSNSTLTIDGDNFGDYFEIEYNTEASTGKYSFAGLKYIGNTSQNEFNTTPEFNTTQIEDIKEYVDASVSAYKYTGGVMYYEARFKHFAGADAVDNGDGTYVVDSNDLAPWNCWETGTNKPSSTESYPGNDAEKNYLGRYGMVRNNWYDVKVEKFLKPGSPVFPNATFYTDGEDGDTPDDNLNDYISVKIHVLSWAKRTQSWGF